MQNGTRHWCAQSLSSWFCDFLPGTRLLKSSNRFAAYSSYPIELELGRIILVISTHNRPKQDFCFQGRCGARLLEYSNRFTAYSSYPIELKRGRMILEIIPHNHSESDFFITPRGAVGVWLLKFPNRFTACSIYPIELKLYDDTRQQSAQSLWAGFSKGA